MAVKGLRKSKKIEALHTPITNINITSVPK